MKEAWKRTRVPIVGVIGIFLITLIAFAVVKPEALTVQKPVWSITGNVVADDALFDGKITANAECSTLDDPVCGTDGQTYKNLCDARKSGVDMRHRGSC